LEEPTIRNATKIRNGRKPRKKSGLAMIESITRSGRSPLKNGTFIAVEYSLRSAMYSRMTPIRIATRN
jgi:hypothetical protein